MIKVANLENHKRHKTKKKRLPLKKWNYFRNETKKDKNNLQIVDDKDNPKMIWGAYCLKNQQTKVTLNTSEAESQAGRQLNVNDKGMKRLLKGG